MRFEKADKMIHYSKKPLNELIMDLKFFHLNLILIRNEDCVDYLVLYEKLIH